MTFVRNMKVGARPDAAFSLVILLLTIVSAKAIVKTSSNNEKISNLINVQ